MNDIFPLLSQRVKHGKPIWTIIQSKSAFISRQNFYPSTNRSSSNKWIYDQCFTSLEFNFSFFLLFNRYENLRSPIKNSFYSFEIGKDSLSLYKKWSCSFFSLPYYVLLLLLPLTNILKDFSLISITRV